ncbi:MAG: transposase [Formosimonas sp.]
MTQHNVSIETAHLADLLNSPSGLSKLLEGLINDVLQAQMSQHLNAGRYEHSSERTSVRNGTRTRKIHSHVGTLTLQVPQTRDGSFCTDIFQHYQLY